MRSNNQNKSFVFGSLLAFALTPALLVACGDDSSPAPASTAPTAAPSSQLSGAKVNSVKLGSLDVVQAEYGDPIAINHPMTVEMTLEVDAEAFTADVGVGMESADGSLRCFIGNIETTHSVPKDAQTATATLSLVKDFYVPPSCRPLVGQANAHIWVSFDTFGRLNVQGRGALTAGDDSKLEDFLQQSRLKTTEGCQTPYAETCEQPFAVLESPGRDLVLSKVDLSTAVGILEYQAKTYLPQIEPGEVDPDGNPLTPLDESKFFARVATTPQVIVNTTTKIYGGDGTDADALPPGAAQVSVFLRPNQLKVPGASELDPTLPFFEPMAMSLEVVKQDKASNTENILRLQRESVDRLKDAQEVTTVSSAFVDGALLEQMTSGMWSKVNSYIMTVCVDSELDEKTPQLPDPVTGEVVDPTENNCQELEFEIVRRPKAATLDGLDVQDSVGIDGAAAEKAFSSKWDTNLGDSDRVRLGLRVSAGVRGDSKAFDVGFNGLLETRGWVNFPLAEVDLAMRDYVEKEKKDEIRKKLNFLLWNNEDATPLPDGDIGSLDLFGEKDKNGNLTNEISKDGPDLAFAQSAGPVTLIAIAKFTGTVGANAKIVKNANKATADCSSGKALGSVCLKPVKEQRDFFGAQSYCRDQGGTVAGPSSKEHYDAIQELRKSMGTDVVWTSMRHVNLGTKQVGSCRQFERERDDAKKRLQECYNKWYRSNKGCDEDFKGDVDSKENSYNSCKKDFGGIPGFRSDWLSSWQNDRGVAVYSGSPWLANNPDDHESGEGYVAIHEGGLNDAPAAWQKPFICEVPLGEGTFFGVNVGPYARLSSKFFAKLSFGGVVEGGVEGDMVLGEVRFSNEGGLTWLHLPEKKSIHSFVSMKSGLEATVLKGKIDYFFRINVPFIPDARGNLYESKDGKKIPLASFINEKSNVSVFSY